MNLYRVLSCLDTWHSQSQSQSSTCVMFRSNYQHNHIDCVPLNGFELVYECGWIPQRHMLNEVYTRQNLMHDSSLSRARTHTNTQPNRTDVCVRVCPTKCQTLRSTNYFIHVKQMCTFKFDVVHSNFHSDSIHIQMKAMLVSPTKHKSWFISYLMGLPQSTFTDSRLFFFDNNNSFILFTAS